MARNFLLVAADFVGVFFDQFLGDGFFAGFEFEDAPEGVDVLAGDGLHDDFAAVFEEVDAGAFFDVELAAELGRDGQLAFGGDVGCVHVISSRLRVKVQHVADVMQVKNVRKDILSYNCGAS